MTAPRDPDDILMAWLDEGPTRLPDQTRRAIAVGLPTVTQRRRLSWVPWRTPMMNGPFRLAAAIAVVAIVGYAALNFLSPVVGPGSAPAATPTATPLPSPTSAPTPVAPGITAWTMYTSEVHGFTVGYPADWSVNAPATRKWQAGDEFPGDSWPYADTFVSPGEGDASIGLFVWEMPAGEGVDVESVPGLKAWAETFCSDVGASSCEEFTERAVPMCLNAGGDSCRGAILVPTAGAQYAFLMDWTSAMFTGIPDLIRVVVVAREDTFPSSARYGGSVALLKAILTTMDVWTPGQVPPAT